MDSRAVTIVAVAAVAAASLASGSAAASTGAVAASSGSHVWHTAIEVPGTATLNRGGGAEITSVSCASPGNCSAGGGFADTSGFQVFVVSQVGGTWHTAVEVPGTAALNRGGEAGIGVSCAAAGNCSGGGFYRDTPNTFQAFVVSQVNGAWHTAVEVPGTAALNRDGNAQIGALSCAAVGNCSAGGSYTDGSGRQQAFVVSQT